MNEMTSCVREEWPAITMVIFRNYQWGAEKRNSILWYDNNFVGTELDPDLSYAKVAQGCGLKGIIVRTMDELSNTLSTACEDQANGITTFIEVILNPKEIYYLLLPVNWRSQKIFLQPIKKINGLRISFHGQEFI